METIHMTLNVRVKKTEVEHIHSSKIFAIAVVASLVAIAIVITALVFSIPAKVENVLTGTSLRSTAVSVTTGMKPFITELTKNPVEEMEPVVIETVQPKTADEVLQECLGNDSIEVGSFNLVRYNTPDVYYPGIDFSRFQPYMDRKMITAKGTPAYNVTHSENVYIDSMGYCRYVTTDDQFTLNGADDYVVALGTYYKPKGTCGSRFLIVTSTGMYTVIAGDEKADIHTDERNMFSRHGANKQYAGVIEWIVDTKTLIANDNMAARMGSIHFSSVPELSGEILMIYGIN